MSRKEGLRLFRSRRDRKSLAGGHRVRDAGEVALPLGMSMAAFVDQVFLKTKRASYKNAPVDQLSRICGGAVRQSLLNVYGDDDQFDGFVEDFEKSFRSTLMTLHFLNKKPLKNNQRLEEDSASDSVSSNITSNHGEEEIEDSASDLVSSNSTEPSSNHGEDQLRNNQLVVHDAETERGMVSFNPNNQSILSTALEKFVAEQARANELKELEIEVMKRQLEVSEDARQMKVWNFLSGLSDASFKQGKFMHSELLRKCTDYLVAGMFVMLSSIGYSVYHYSHQRIIEATESCAAIDESDYYYSRSWGVPNPMAYFNSVWQATKCHSQIWVKISTGGLMIIVIAYLLLQRPSGSTRAMPVTSIGLLLAVGCGFAGSLCIDTLGGNGRVWLLFWEILCCLHLFANMCTEILFRILYGSPKVSSKGMKTAPPAVLIPYCMRRCVFFTTTCFLLPLLCGFLPFASLGESMYPS